MQIILQKVTDEQYDSDPLHYKNNKLLNITDNTCLIQALII